MSVAESIAIDTAISRVIVSMQAKFALELASSEVAIGGLPLDAPGAADWYTVGSEDFVEAVVDNAMVTGFAYQASPSEIDTNVTGSVTEYQAYQSFELDVVIAYSMSLWEPIVRNGKTLTMTDAMTLRGHRYNAGVINVMRKYARDGISIECVEKVSDFAGNVVFNEDMRPVRGYAGSTWRIKQVVDVHYTGIESGATYGFGLGFSAGFG